MPDADNTHSCLKRARYGQVLFLYKVRLMPIDDQFNQPNYLLLTERVIALTPLLSNLTK